jgi:hypothetical protein
MSRQINLRVTDEIYDAIQIKAIEEGTTVTGLVLAAVNRFQSRGKVNLLDLTRQLVHIQAAIINQENTDKLDQEFLTLYQEWVNPS